VISIVVPTIAGREEHLARCLNAYEKNTVSEIELIVVRGKPHCGAAWNAGIARAAGEFVHLTADDLEPHAGWDEAAIRRYSLAAMRLPAPCIYRPDGKVESVGGDWPQTDTTRERNGHITANTCVIPFFPRVIWPSLGPMIEAHYYTDNYFSDRARAAGWEFIISRRYAFTHHWASEGRGAGMTEPERLAHDRAIYEAAIA
jgi:hypothetical protein